MALLLSIFLRLHRDERGAEGLEKLLIMAAIVLPLLGLLIFLRDDISRWASDSFLVLRGQSVDAPP